MDYLKKKFSSFNLHLIKTNRFKTINIEIIFNHDIRKEKVTITNFLSSMMSFTTAKYNTKLKFAQKLEDLYAARIFSNNYRIGKSYITDFEMRILNDKYAENGLLDNALSFLKELLFNPNVDNGMFDENSFNIIKNDELSQINRLKEDSKAYSITKMFEHMDSNSVLSINTKGYEEDLNSITRENLYDFYKEFICCNDIDIFMVGDIDFDYVTKLVEEKFNFKSDKNNDNNLLLDYRKHKKEVLEVIEDDNTKQSKLAIACTLEDMTKRERDYVLNLYNLILGGTADSKFFKNIREKFSLCYYVSSKSFKQDNILLITSGISKENFSKIKILIDKEMQDMRDGKITDNDISKAKKYYISSLDEIDDSPNQIIASYYAIDKLKVDDVEERKKKIMDVSKDEIVKLANKVYIDTIYLLGGDKK